MSNPVAEQRLVLGARAAFRESPRGPKVSKRALSLAHLESRSHALEGIARGEPLKRVLHSLVRAVEALSGGMLGSVLLLARDGWHITHGAAPSLPRAYLQALEGLKIGPTVGSCGTAMYLAKPVIVADVLAHPLWRDYRELARRHGLRACWSVPIVSRREVLGAFALYYRQPRLPSDEERRLVEVAAQLAAIAIVRARGTRDPAVAGLRRGKLSPRELEIVRLIALGQSAKRIAWGLRISLSTVYTHRTRILGKLGVRSDAQITRYAIASRLVD